MAENPFTTHRYTGPANFCDRNQELSTLIDMFDNDRFGLIYSMRRLGKTGLIHHFHHTLNKRNNTIAVYCDVQNTNSDSEFASKLISAVISATDKTQQAVIKRVSTFFAGLRPVLTFDPVSQMPSLQLNIQTQQDTEMSLRLMMEMLGQIPKKIQIAIDEFQQIAHYPASVIEATLRGYLHKAPNVHFLFCGSQQHLLLELFSDAKRPFFGTVEHLQLGLLEQSIYHEFICDHFRAAGQSIEDEAVNDILQWTRGHTFYTQYMCNRLFSKNYAHIGNLEVDQEKQSILFSFEPSYLGLQSVLSKHQLKLMKAIAKEGSVTGVSSSGFLNKYRLAQSTAQQAVKVLLDKELLYQRLQPDESVIFVYDPFFSRWLETR